MKKKVNEYLRSIKSKDVMMEKLKQELKEKELEVQKKMEEMKK